MRARLPLHATTLRAVGRREDGATVELESHQAEPDARADQKQHASRRGNKKTTLNNIHGKSSAPMVSLHLQFGGEHYQMIGSQDKSSRQCESVPAVTGQCRREFPGY